MHGQKNIKIFRINCIFLPQLNLVLARWKNVRFETCNFLEWKKMSCFDSMPITFYWVWKHNVVSSVMLRIHEFLVDDSPNSQNGKVFCKVFTSPIHVPSCNFYCPDPFSFPRPSPTSKANIPLILRRRSIMENVLCGIRRPGICVLVPTTCRILMITCAAKYEVRFTIFWEFVIADRFYHRKTAGQVEQNCHIILQHRLETWSGLRSWGSLWCAYSHLHPLDPSLCKRAIIRIRGTPKTKFFLCSMRRRSSYNGAVC